MKSQTKQGHTPIFSIVRAEYNLKRDSVFEKVVSVWPSFKQAKYVFEKVIETAPERAICITYHPNHDGLNLAESRSYQKEYRKIHD